LKFELNSSMKCLLAVCALQAALARCAADNGWEGHLFSLTWENDAISDSDKHYTQGATISYWTKDDDFPAWVKKFSGWIPTVGLTVEAQKAGLGFGQELYTPADLRSSGVVPDDRPYAGWLYGSLRIRRRGLVSSGRWAMEDFRLDLGVVGPEALGEETQKPLHGEDPQGWDNQLETEPGGGPALRPPLFAPAPQRAKRLGRGLGPLFRRQPGQRGDLL
jgi:hypothetical protein